MHDLDDLANRLAVLEPTAVTPAVLQTLRDDLAEGRLSVADVHHALLRVAYRMLFTFVAEDRGALLDPNATPQARQRYTDYFSTDRLRRTARRRPAVVRRRASRAVAASIAAT